MSRYLHSGDGAGALGGYAASADRPRRADALEAEREEALRRTIALPPIVAPARESERRVRALGRRDDVRVPVADQTAVVAGPWRAAGHAAAAARRRVCARQAKRAAEDSPGGRGEGIVSRVYIQSSTWSVPPAWFVPFAPTERWLVLGTPGERDGSRPATASATRTLVYATTMAQARRRVARALGTVRRVPGAGRGAGSPAGTRVAMRRPELTSFGPASRSRRSGAGWRSSIRIRWWNSITEGWCSYSTTTHSGRTSQWLKYPPPSAPWPAGSLSSQPPCTSDCGPGGGIWRQSN